MRFRHKSHSVVDFRNSFVISSFHHSTCTSLRPLLIVVQSKCQAYLRAFVADFGGISLVHQLAGSEPARFLFSTLHCPSIFLIHAYHNLHSPLGFSICVLVSKCTVLWSIFRNISKKVARATDDHLCSCMSHIWQRRHILHDDTWGLHQDCRDR